MKFLWPPLAILTCISAGWMVYRDSMLAEPAVETKSRPRTAMAVEVTQLSKRDLFESVDLVGSLQASADIHIYARGDGYLVKVPYDVQDEVKEGDEIAILDDSAQKEMVASTEAALKVTKARLKAQQTKLDQALSDYRRQQDLDKSGVSTVQQMEASRSAFQIAQAELELQQAEVDQAIANHQTSEVSLRQMRVRAPVTGIVADRIMNVGDLVSPEKEIMRIVVLDEMKTVVNIVEKDYEKVRVGQIAEIRLETFPGKIFKGTVERKAPVVDPTTRMAEIHISIPNDDHALKPGMHARVRIRTNVIPQADVLPVASLLHLKGKTQMYVVEGDPAVTTLREVEVGTTDGDFVQILSGITAEDKVVSLGSQMVENGDEVAVVEKSSLDGQLAKADTPKISQKEEIDSKKKKAAATAAE
ncbi:MAG: hypothetical protein CMJ46_12345 [Planctomyces sp.]|nr:hypothetical protein [Planctomyces sp.]